MARHIFIGDATAVSYAAGGTLAAGAIDVQKLSTSGPTSMLANDTRTNTEQFRIVQGDGTRDIVSPWLYGKDIINSTPGWQMEMDKLFTLIEELASELKDLTSAAATYTTGVGPTGPATNASKVAKIVSDIKAMKQ